MASCGGSDSSTVSDPNLVQTAQGQAKGVAVNGVHAYLGLPYAAPPVGALRWKAPVAAAAYSGVRDASHAGSECVQGLPAATAGSEDCLYMNIYVPGPTTVTTPLPVLFWIHGGGFINGSGIATDGSALAVKANAIVVTFNYRLNALGFLAHPALAAEDPNGAAGNYGIMDQAAALTWVQKNIAAFGGDPKNVTIFGDSAGGHSVYVQLASPGSAGLFAKAVAAVDSDAHRQSGNAVGCDDGGAVVVCSLRQSEYRERRCELAGVYLCNASGSRFWLSCFEHI